MGWGKKIKKAVKSVSKAVSSAIPKSSGTGIGSQVKETVAEQSKKTLGTEGSAKVGKILSTGDSAKTPVLRMRASLDSGIGHMMQDPAEKEEKEAEERAEAEEVQAKQQAYDENAAALENTANLLQRQAASRTDYTSMRGLLGDYATGEEDTFQNFRKRKNF